jgi:hypothetical protein
MAIFAKREIASKVCYASIRGSVPSLILIQIIKVSNVNCLRVPCGIGNVMANKGYSQMKFNLPLNICINICYTFRSYMCLDKDWK